MDKNAVFVLEDEVRLNETDLQGIVNHANYFIYMAHARHKHFQAFGIELGAMHDAGFNLVLVRSEVDFKASLKNGDTYIVTSKFEPMGRIRFVFVQQVIRKADQKVIVEAKNIGACVSTATGKPVVPDKLCDLFSV